MHKLIRFLSVIYNTSILLIHVLIYHSQAHALGIVSYEWPQWIADYIIMSCKIQLWGNIASPYWPIPTNKIALYFKCVYHSTFHTIREISGKIARNKSMQGKIREFEYCLKISWTNQGNYSSELIKPQISKMLRIFTIVVKCWYVVAHHLSRINSTMVFNKHLCLCVAIFSALWPVMLLYNRDKNQGIS